MQIAPIHSITLGLVLVTTLAMACNSSESGSDIQSSASSACPAPPISASTSDLAKQPSVSFANEITPILDQSCTFSSCHGIQGTRIVFKGPTAHQNMLVNAQELPSMKIVAPGDPDNSFLMHKLDGTQCSFGAECTSGDCESSMPKGGDLLPIENRDTFRRWIAQGALDN